MYAEKMTWKVNEVALLGYGDIEHTMYTAAKYTTPLEMQNKTEPK